MTPIRFALPLLRPFTLVLGMLVVFGVLASTATHPLEAEAGWKFWKKEPVVEEPPPPTQGENDGSPFTSPEKSNVWPPPKDMVKTDCDPIKKQLQDVYSASWLAKPFLIPRRERLRNKHYQCLQEFNDREKAYIENNILLPDDHKAAEKPEFRDLDDGLTTQAQTNQKRDNLDVKLFD